MKIAVCISGSLRDSTDIIAKNLKNLIDAGHQIYVYMHLQNASSGFRNSYDGNLHSKFGICLPFIKGFETPYIQSNLDEICIALNIQSKIRFESRNFQKILFDFGLNKTWSQLQNIGIEIPGTSELLRPHLPHFRNTLFMLVNMYEAERERINSDLEVDGVLRLRPDFLMSQTFINNLDTESLVIPIRTSGREFDYGWGHSSDQCFFSNTSIMSSMSEVVLHLEDLWSEKKVYVPESISAPFMYGDVLFGYWMHHELDIRKKLVDKGGDLVREKTVRKYLWHKNFFEHRNQYRNWINYNRTVAQWQKIQRYGSPSN